MIKFNIVFFTFGISAKGERDRKSLKLSYIAALANLNLKKNLLMIEKIKF